MSHCESFIKRWTSHGIEREGHRGAQSGNRHLGGSGVLLQRLMPKSFLFYYVFGTESMRSPDTSGNENDNSKGPGLFLKLAKMILLMCKEWKFLQCLSIFF